MPLEGYTTEQLKMIIANREKEEEKSKPKNRPRVLYNAMKLPGHFNRLIEQCEQIIDEIMNGDYDDDNPQYTYELAMTLIYGPKIWDWINKNTP
jgi:hypothetical protein